MVKVHLVGRYLVGRPKLRLNLLRHNMLSHVTFTIQKSDAKIFGIQKNLIQWEFKWFGIPTTI